MPSEGQICFDTLRPACVTEFRCDGSICDSKCCHGWSVPVDEEHYSLYQKIPNSKIRRRVLSAVKRSENGKYVMKLSAEEGEACALLEADGLCFLQKNLGEKYLSSTCALYPRVAYLLGNMASGSLTLTCPIARKLLLLGKNPMRLERVQAPLLRDGCWAVQPKMDAGAFRIVQETALALLQQRCYALDERLALLGFFVDRVDEALGARSEERELSDIAEFYLTPAAAALQPPQWGCVA